MSSLAINTLDTTRAAEPPALSLARAHEAIGPAATAFAAMQAGARQKAQAGPVIWIEGPKREGRLDPYGLAQFLDPEQLILIDAPSQKDAFWAMEEILRSGAAAAVICAAGVAADLTQSRRLQLAAEAGAQASGEGAAALALLISPEGATSPAAETRWRADPAPSWAERGADGAPRWIWTLLKNKRGPLGAWSVQPSQGGFAPISEPVLKAAG